MPLKYCCSLWRPCSEHHLCGGHALAGHQHVEYRVFPDVAHGLFVGDHGEVVAVALQDLVVDPQTCSGGGTALVHLGHIDALFSKGKT